VLSYLLSNKNNIKIIRGKVKRKRKRNREKCELLIKTKKNRK